MDVPYLVVHLSIDGHLGCYFLALMINAVVIFVCKFLYGYLFSFGGVYTIE